MPTVTITGGSGLIGTALRQALLSKGYGVIILGRKKEGRAGKNLGESGFRMAHWDPGNGELDKDAIENTDYIVHLAGANVG